MTNGRSPIRVLVVDDDPQLQDLLKYSLEAFGLTVVGTANNGLEAIDLFCQIRPDAVVLDLRMPVMDGLSTLTRLREIDPNCIALMITGSHEDEERRQALAAGAVGFLHKPFRVDELFRDIQKSFRTLLARRNDSTNMDEHYVRYVLGQGKPERSAAEVMGLEPAARPEIPLEPRLPERTLGIGGAVHSGPIPRPGAFDGLLDADASSGLSGLSGGRPASPASFPPGAGTQVEGAPLPAPGAGASHSGVAGLPPATSAEPGSLASRAVVSGQRTEGASSTPAAFHGAEAWPTTREPDRVDLTGVAAPHSPEDTARELDTLRQENAHLREELRAVRTACVQLCENIDRILALSTRR